MASQGTAGTIRVSLHNHLYASRTEKLPSCNPAQQRVSCPISSFGAGRAQILYRIFECTALETIEIPEPNGISYILHGCCIWNASVLLIRKLNKHSIVIYPFFLPKGCCSSIFDDLLFVVMKIQP
ncbi:hypothetical protein RIF29_25076 [Crotalaria pallida]|uniref:Uncharacterized protein n=1 Tax=Crotalaria pallida TaxID=3830 RepID=A0AAN9ELP2_CROPI